MPTDLQTMSPAALDYLMKAAPVLVLHLDAEQRITTANAHARRVLGDVVGHRLPEIVVDFTDAIDWSSLIAEGGRHLLSLTTRAGMPESFFFHFLRDAGGTWALGSWDVQEQERLRNVVLELNRESNELSRQLHQANAELRELNQVKNQFLGMAAHDLRKPIGVIMTYGQFVLDEAGPELTGEHREFLQTCLEAAVGMKRLIDSFLDLAVIESGRLRLELAPAGLVDITGPALAVAQLVARRKGVVLLTEIPADERRLDVDASQLQQVLLNLIGNAVEHSLPGKRVWLSARWDAAELVFAVRDEGPGIPAEAQRRLFMPFERAGACKTAGERSTGLGLAIARKIVEAHRGRLWVESTVGCGATFYVALQA